MRTYVCKDCSTVVEVAEGKYLKQRCPACTRNRKLGRQIAWTYVCKDCATVVEVSLGEYRKQRCTPCQIKRTLGKQKVFKTQLKTNSHAARGALNKPEKSRQFALRMAAIAPYTRAETAQMLGVSDEQIRQDEIRIIMKIRKHCSELAKECGYKVT